MEVRISIVFLFASPGENGKRGEMEYKKFEEKIINLLQEKMGAGYVVQTAEVMKNNDIRLRGIVILRESDKISPTIYLEEPYRKYCGGADMQEIAEQIAALYEEQERHIHFDMDFFCEYGRVKDRIFYKLVHYGKNRRLLEDVPHFKWHDLAVVFYYAMEEKLLGKASILIHSNHLDMWEQSAEKLYRDAQDNMKRGMPEQLIPLQEMIESITGVKPQKEKEVQMYVLTNAERMYGAAVMLYSEKMKELADSLQSDLLLLPSSVHEILVLPDTGNAQYRFYLEMVEEINTTQVEPEEVLSYGLYRYNRMREEIEEIAMEG